MKKWEIFVKIGENNWKSIGIFNKMQTFETIKEYLTADYEVKIVPITKKTV